MNIHAYVYYDCKAGGSILIKIKFGNWFRLNDFLGVLAVLSAVPGDLIIIRLSPDAIFNHCHNSGSQIGRPRMMSIAAYMHITQSPDLARVEIS